MTNPTVQDLLKKINFIEADLEIQKQILVSIPSDDKDDIESTIVTISNKNKEIKELRQQIKELDPEEYDRILLFENAVKKFKELATQKGFQSIVGRNTDDVCILELKNSPGIDCLLKASDSDGNWTIVTMEGQIKEFSGDEVDELPPEPTQ